MVEHLGFSRLGLWDEGFVEDIEDVLADLLELGFDLLAIVTDGRHVLVRALGFFLLLDGRNDSPGSTSGPNHVLVGNGEEVALVDRELTTQLAHVRSDDSGLSAKL